MVLRKPGQRQSIGQMNDLSSINVLAQQILSASIVARIRSGDGDTVVRSQDLGAHILGGRGRPSTKHTVDYIGILGLCITEKYES